MSTLKTNTKDKENRIPLLFLALSFINCARAAPVGIRWTGSSWFPSGASAGGGTGGSARDALKAAMASWEASGGGDDALKSNLKKKLKP